MTLERISYAEKPCHASLNNPLVHKKLGTNITTPPFADSTTHAHTQHKNEIPTPSSLAKITPPFPPPLLIILEHALLVREQGPSISLHQQKCLHKRRIGGGDIQPPQQPIRLAKKPFFFRSGEPRIG